MRRLLTAGLLQYSKPLYDEIEKHLLEVYASIYLPEMEPLIKQGEKRLEKIRAVVQGIRELAKRLKNPSPQDGQMLLQLLAPLVMSGALGEADIDLSDIANRLMQGRSLEKHIPKLEKFADRLESEADEALGEHAKGLRDDIERWKEHYNPEMTKRLQKGPPNIEIDLDMDKFPFLKGKFEKNVKKVRGDDAGVLDEMPKIKLKVQRLGPGQMGYWNSQDNTLVVGLPDPKRRDAILRGMRQTVRHELAHVTQTVMARALGVEHLRMDEEGNFMPAYKAGPGMGPKKTLDPDIHQAFAQMDQIGARVAQLEKYEKWGTIKPAQAKELEKLRRLRDLRKNVLESRKLKSPAATYSLDDMEFYTHLADRITEFDERLEKMGELSPSELELARDLWIGRRWIPQSSEKKALDWIAENDPENKVWSHFAQGMSPFFRHLKKYKPEKYKKAVKEFAKATSDKFQAPAQKGSVQAQWREFLDEAYEGGKKKIQNPNSKTRDRYPEITVSYLMGRTEPAYQGARKKIRSEFARWRAQKQGPGGSAPSRRGPASIFEQFEQEPAPKRRTERPSKKAPVSIFDAPA
jgi:hypothetical protein